MKFYTIAIVSFLIIISRPLFAQKDTVVYQKNTREYYVEDLTHKLNISLFSSKNTNDMSLVGKSALNYKSNDLAALGIGIRLYWLGFSLSYSPKVIADKLKGTTTYTYLKLNGYGRRIGFELYYLGCRGYYLNNSGSFQQLDLNPINYYTREDLKTLSIGSNFYFIFNHKKYSYRSTFIQNEIQKHSAGSFMLSASVNYYRIKGDSSIVPQKLGPNIFNDAAQIDRGNFYNLSLMPGYGHTFVAFKRFFLTLSLFGGLDFQQQHYVSQLPGGEKSYNNFAVIPRIMGRSGLGYNSRHFYTGINAYLDLYSLPLGKNEHINYSNSIVTLYIGYHFNLPKPWQNALQKYRKFPFFDFSKQAG